MCNVQDSLLFLPVRDYHECNPIFEKVCLPGDTQLNDSHPATLYNFVSDHQTWHYT